MISNIYKETSQLPAAAETSVAEKAFRELRKPFIATVETAQRPRARSFRGTRGFTLTELMIVLAVISIVAVIAFIGLRNNQWEGAYLRFTDDLVGTFIQARNRAIDDQTEVRVEVSQDKVEVYLIEPDNPPPDTTVFGTGTFLWGNYRDRIDGGLIADQACITGMEPGIKPPSEANDAQMPADCGSNLPRAILFQPDGSFTLDNDPLPDAGMTVVIRDSSSAQVYYSIIEMFPGGLIRKYDEIPQL